MNEEQTRAARIVLDYLEENNSHTIGRLLTWDLFGEEDPKRDELRYRTWLVAKQFEEAYYMEESKQKCK
jgi:hypothetical protein